MQFKQTIRPVKCPVITLNGRSCRTKQYTCMFKLCPLYCSLTGMIFWRIITLITGFVFLIYNNDSQILKWCK